ncbi:hypothetical protein [Lysobacter gummosus]|uniref:hypothetical protein n=1 Tax=Lysobacter gummosus TaxID=262324 RepID=UPI003640F3F5
MEFHDCSGPHPNPSPAPRRKSPWVASGRGAESAAPAFVQSRAIPTRSINPESSA